VHLLSFSQSVSVLVFVLKEVFVLKASLSRVCLWKCQIRVGLYTVDGSFPDRIPTGRVILW